MTEQLNKTLRRHTWTSKDRVWTKEQLESERVDYFDTRVTGRPEIWQTLKAVLEILWLEDGISGDGSDNLLTAQTMLSAAEISLPTGDLVDGAYDSFGNYYALPQWVVAEPQNLIESQDVENSCDAQNGTATVTVVSGGNTCNSSSAQDSSLAPEKQTQLRARLSETGKDLTVRIGKSDSIQDIINQISRQYKVSQYNIGKDLLCLQKHDSSRRENGYA